MKNKILTGITALCIVGAVVSIPESISPVVSVTAKALDTYKGFTYKIGFDNTVTITDYDNSATVSIHRAFCP